MSDTLIGVIVGGCIVTGGNLAIQLLAHLLSAKKERQQQILKRELDRFFKLEELVGEVVEMAGSYEFQPGYEPGLTDPKESLNALSNQAGRFRRYRRLKQAIRDLHNCACRLLDERQRHEDERETRKELEQKYSAFINRFDEIIGKREI